MKLRVDEARCQGHALCHAAAPQLFRLRDEDGHSSAVQSDVAPDLENAARRAALGCPEQAIRLEED
jgi:ferredoxin